MTAEEIHVTIRRLRDFKKSDLWEFLVNNVIGPRLDAVRGALVSTASEADPCSTRWAGALFELEKYGLGLIDQAISALEYQAQQAQTEEEIEKDDGVVGPIEDNL